MAQGTSGATEVEGGSRAAAGARLRVAVAVAAVVVVAGAAGLTLYAAGIGREQRPARPQVDRAASEPPVRLDTLSPSRRRGEREGRDKDASPAAPATPTTVVGVGTDEFLGERSNAVVDVDGRARYEPIASDAEIRRALVALERENARIEAALKGLGGPGIGTGELIWPVRGPVTSPFGPRWGRLHAGIDIGASTGTDVHASDSGRVVMSGPVGGYGNYICIQHNRSLTTCYAHNSRLGVRRGDRVRKGAVIAKSGCTGHCYGPHVHFETRVNGRPVDPLRYLR